MAKWFPRFLLLTAGLLFLDRCASYAVKIQEPRYLLEAGHYEVAIEKLKVLAEARDNDELLYLMDLGYAYHLAARYPEAIQAFLRAEKIAEIVDYTSLSQEVGSVVLNDEIKPYKGENFEKLLINTYLAMDYALSHQYEEALVECRKVNHKLDLMIAEGGLPYEQNAFAKYLAATLFEARKEYNDAFVDYRLALKWFSDYHYLPSPLLRMADKLKASQEFDEYKKRYPGVTDFRIEKKQGEIVLLLEQGKAPLKVPSSQMRLIPVFEKREFSSDYVWLGTSAGKNLVRSYPLFDIERTAIRELDHRLGQIIAKKVGGVIAKEILAHQVEKQADSPLAGFLARVLLHGTDRADLRSWTTLPATLQIARVTLPVGVHDVYLNQVDKYGRQFRVKEWKQLEVKPLEKVFLNYRTQD